MSRLRGYKLCPECGQPMLKRGQSRKHPDDYRHAQGCPLSDAEIDRSLAWMDHIFGPGWLDETPNNVN